MSGITIVRRASGAKPTRQIDFTESDAMTDADIASAVADDPEAAPLADASWFAAAKLVEPDTKEKISIRIDRDVLEFFRKEGRYQSRINAVLRAYVEHERRRA